MVVRAGDDAVEMLARPGAGTTHNDIDPPAAIAKDEVWVGGPATGEHG